jgi:small subunit ribosomal protein S21
MKSKVTVEVRDGNIETALKIFKSKVFNSGHIVEYKERQEYVKPSVIKRKKLKKSIYSQKIKQNKEK